MPTTALRTSPATCSRRGYIESALYQLASGQKTCFGNGTYQRPSADVFPMPGVLYAQCLLSVSANHAPSNAGGW